ncbi:uncharacterized protein PG986_015089 [Apiospora aurea]|uniref:Uncharacterized protein n=1 Tax=Apiospora aurea TaxID=335848 RepID=A0ABR1PRK4_9PEZI
MPSRMGPAPYQAELEDGSESSMAILRHFKSPSSVAPLSRIGAYRPSSSTFNVVQKADHVEQEHVLARGNATGGDWSSPSVLDLMAERASGVCYDFLGQLCCRLRLGASMQKARGDKGLIQVLAAPGGICCIGCCNLGGCFCQQTSCADLFGANELRHGADILDLAGHSLDGTADEDRLEGKPFDDGRFRCHSQPTAICRLKYVGSEWNGLVGHSPDIRFKDEVVQSLFLISAFLRASKVLVDKADCTFDLVIGHGIIGAA